MKNLTYKTILYFSVIVIGVLVFAPGFAMAKTEYTYSNFQLVSVDSFGNKVTSVRYSIYNQETDINGNSYAGKKITTGIIGESGYKEVKIKMPVDTESKYLITFRNGKNVEYQTFHYWNQKIKAGETKNIKLLFSTVDFIIKDSDGELVKDKAFDIYSVITDVAGNQVRDKRIIKGAKTGNDGKASIHLKPGNYIMLVSYNNKLPVDEYIFTVKENDYKNITYTLSNITIRVSDNGYYKKNMPFKLYYKDNVGGQTVYRYIAKSNTGEYAIKKIYLPNGDYKIVINSGTFTKEEYFSLKSGQDINFSYNLATFKFKLQDIDGNPLKNYNLKVYKYGQSAKGEKVLEKKTDSNGYIKGALNSGRYYVVIPGSEKGLEYTTSIYIDEDEGYKDNKFTYTIGATRIYLKNNTGQAITDTKFSVYNYKTNSKGELAKGKGINTYTTDHNGLSLINLPTGKYVIEVKGYKGLYSFAVVDQQLNRIFLNINGEGQANVSQVVAQFVANPLTNANYISSIYLTDTDGDGLSDFEEIYIYNTNPHLMDTDGDGYADKTEIQNNYNPLGNGQYTYQAFSYGQPRLNSVAKEQNLAQSLKLDLEARLGQGNLKISAQNWHTVVNSYIYGGYTVDEIAHTIKYGPGKVHPSIPASAWRK